MNAGLFRNGYGVAGMAVLVVKRLTARVQMTVSDFGCLRVFMRMLGGSQNPQSWTDAK